MFHDRLDAARQLDTVLVRKLRALRDAAPAAGPEGPGALP